MNYKRMLFVLVYICFSCLMSIEIEIPRLPGSLDIADIDLDGDLDIIVGHMTGWGYDNPTISLIENLNYSDIVVQDTSLVFCGRQSNIHFAKMNSDEYMDIVCFYADLSSGTTESYIRVLYNSNGSFDEHIDFQIEGSYIYHDLEKGNFNNDEFDDIVFMSNSSCLIGIMTTNDEYSFNEVEYFVLGMPPQSLQVGNILGDERDEILVPSSDILIFSNTEEGWTRTVVDSLNGASEAAIYDIDGDGDNEVLTYLVPPMGDNCILRIYEKEDESFVNVFENVYSFPSGLNVFDYNNDGFPDLMLGNYLVINYGNYVFSEPVDTNTNVDHRGDFYDMDNNGYLDIVQCYQNPEVNRGYLRIMFNDGEGNFVPEPAVENVDDEVVFSGNNLSNYPNPFNPETNITFTLPRESDVKLSIYNVKGQKVKSLVNSRFTKGQHSILWNGLDNNNSDVSSGIYFYKLETDSKTISKKMILLK